MRTRYRNSFYSQGKGGDPEWYEVEVKPIEYRGYQLFNRIKAPTVSRSCWDVVFDGSCIGQYCGLTGAKGFVNRLLDGDPVDEVHPVVPSDSAPKARGEASAEPQQDPTVTHTLPTGAQGKGR